MRIMNQNPIIIKVGSSSVINKNGTSNAEFFQKLVALCGKLVDMKYAPLVVLSGAVASGKSELSLRQAPAQVLAARGQLLLSSAVLNVAQQQDLLIAQLLLSREDILNRKRYKSLRETLRWSVEHSIIPVINENDATSPGDEHDFIDNDQLAIIISLAAGAKQLYLLTDIDGVYRTDPAKAMSGGPINEISDVNQVLMKIHTGKRSAMGRGGIITKLHAARLASFIGITTYILDARTIEKLPSVITGDLCLGTRCLPWTEPLRLTDRNRWLLATHTSNASIMIDGGAVQALRKRRSLLAVGVKKLFGGFVQLDSVEVIDEQFRPVAFGVVEIGSKELQKQINNAERPFNIEVIHADKLILFPV